MKTEITTEGNMFNVQCLSASGPVTLVHQDEADPCTSVKNGSYKLSTEQNKKGVTHL